MRKQISTILTCFLFCTQCFCQFPWNNPLKIATSSDGISFNTPTIFQDSSGVPSVIKWKGDTLVAAFQWFRAPNPSVTWDRVAVKFSYDNGLNWTQPVPIVVNGLPAQYQRPFDPTLAVINNDSLRIYFSSSDGIPLMGLDSTINTYSATTTDGISFAFESSPRVDHLTNKLIDPAVIYFNNSWHYIAPIGAPQQGAFHYISPDGINFSQVQNIPSDNNHNWTGNYMIENNTELRFYGSGQNIWFNATANGGVWNGYVATNLQGGDPAALKISANNYLIIFVGQPYTTSLNHFDENTDSVHLYPNPANHQIVISTNKKMRHSKYSIFSSSGLFVSEGILASDKSIVDIHSLSSGIYFLTIEGLESQSFQVIKNEVR